MARIRTIKPEFWSSEQVVDCSAMARLLFIGLWNFCDDAGIHPANERRIKMSVFPGDDIDSATIRRLVGELETNGLIEVYDAEGHEYLQVTGWDKHQKIEKKNYKHPKPPANRRKRVSQSPTERRPVADRSPPEGNGREVELEGNGEGVGDPSTTEPNSPVPNAPAKPAAGKPYAFEGKIIKLTGVDLERWRKSFGSIRNLEAELESLDAWHAKNGTTGKDWFHRVASALAKKDAEGPAARPGAAEEDPRMEDRRRWATEVQVFRSGKWADRYPDRPKPGEVGCLWPGWLQQEELVAVGKPRVIDGGRS